MLKASMKVRSAAGSGFAVQACRNAVVASMFAARSPSVMSRSSGAAGPVMVESNALVALTNTRPEIPP